jgi:tryptophanyl-tRNA synthetase
MKRIFSGMQPTGNLHLGNYLGAVRNWVSLQHDYECFFCIVDMHAITVPQNPTELQRATREVTAAYIASGVDPKRCAIYHQSALGGYHAELSWILGTITPLGWLFGYPVLMAADILLYHATHVPVGEDQKQHLELARDIAGAFNNQFEEDFFPLPEPQIFGEATRVMSLRDGTSKMSKSDTSDQSRINLTDDADAIAQKIKRAKTDPEMLPEQIEGLEGRHEAANLVGIYAALSDKTTSEVLSEFGGKGFGQFKPALADLAVSVLSPITSEMRRLLADPAEIDLMIADGATRARTVAEPILKRTKELVGFLEV